MDSQSAWCVRTGLEISLILGTNHMGQTKQIAIFCRGPGPGPRPGPLGPLRPFGQFGPIGPFRPFGPLGPLGPLDPFGPIGSNGPWTTNNIESLLDLIRGWKWSMSLRIRISRFLTPTVMSRSFRSASQTFFFLNYKSSGRIIKNRKNIL